MTKETMMNILNNPTTYNANERLAAARLAITFLDLLSVADNDVENEPAVEADAEGRCKSCGRNLMDGTWE